MSTICLYHRQRCVETGLEDPRNQRGGKPTLNFVPLTRIPHFNHKFLVQMDGPIENYHSIELLLKFRGCEVVFGCPGCSPGLGGGIIGQLGHPLRSQGFEQLSGGICSQPEKHTRCPGGFSDSVPLLEHTLKPNCRSNWAIEEQFGAESGAKTRVLST